MFNNKNILITGGTGSFGIYFTRYILKNDRERGFTLLIPDHRPG